jgi:hypothetical protein
MVIADVEFEKAESNYLQKQYQFEGAKTALANTQIQLTQLEQAVLDIQLQYHQQRSQLELSLREAYNNLNNQIASWEHNYLLKSPIEGVVTFTKIWSSNQNLKVGDIAFTVVPEKSDLLIGKVILPIQGSGKVKPGQRVNIKLVNYPYLEYGMVRGIVKTISLIPTDNNYFVEVELPNGLASSYGKSLAFSQEMQGIAEIITDDLRLLERLLNPIKAALNKNS